MMLYHEFNFSFFFADSLGFCYLNDFYTTWIFFFYYYEMFYSLGLPLISDIWGCCPTLLKTVYLGFEDVIS